MTFKWQFSRGSGKLVSCKTKTKSTYQGTWDKWWHRTWWQRSDGSNPRMLGWSVWGFWSRCRREPRCRCSRSRLCSLPVDARIGWRCRVPLLCLTPGGHIPGWVTFEHKVGKIASLNVLRTDFITPRFVVFGTNLAKVRSKYFQWVLIYYFFIFIYL